MVTDAELEREFRGVVRDHLEVLTQPLIEALRALIHHPFPEQVVEISFEVFRDGFTSGFPVRAFFMDRDNCEFFLRENGKAVYPSPIDPGLLDIPRVYSRAVDDRYDAVPDQITVAGDELVPWFAECWQAAGGSGFTRRATIAFHDGVRELNLMTGTFQKTYAGFD
jgi:hypothetical protein